MALDQSQIEKVFTLLVSSPNGLTAKEISSRIEEPDLRLIREMTRASMKVASKRKLTTSAQRIKGSAIKIYNIVPKRAKQVEEESNDKK